MLRNTHQQTGVALVLVLALTALLTIMAGSYTLSMRRQLDLVRNSRDHSQALALAEAGLSYAQMMLLVNDQQKRWRTDGTEYKRPYAGGNFKVKIIEETGKVDINNAQLELLNGLFESIGLEEEQAVEIVDAILDWRDKDDLVRLHGAEKKDYEDEDLPYQPRNDLFQTIEELELVLGITPEIYQKLEQLLTVYSSAAGIDPTKASRAVLMAIPGIDAEIVDTYLTERQTAADNNEPAPPFPAQAGIAFEQQSVDTYSIESQGILNTGATATVFTTIRNPEGNARGPFELLSWKKMFGNNLQKKTTTDQEQDDDS
ncbi:MAG: type II secretion system protein GspK [Methylococcales bacterium]